MKSCGFVVLFFLLILSMKVCGRNILGFFIHPGYSHFKVFSPILQGLAKRGHNLTVITYFSSDLNLTNYEEIILTGEYTRSSLLIDNINPSRSIYQLFVELFDLMQEGQDACEQFFHSKVADKVIEKHKSFPFDLVVTEIFNTDCMLGLIHLLNVPFIGLSSCALMPWHYNRISYPDFPSFIPSEFVGSSDDMVYWERFKNFLIIKVGKLLWRLGELQDNNKIRRELGINIDVQEITKQTSLILVNQHFSLSGARPLPPNVIEIGGVHISNTSNTLSQELESFLSESKEGVIFISWGSLIKFSSIPQEKTNSIVKALQKLDLRIVWKWEDNSSIPLKWENVYYSSWFLQKDTLCHPKVKLFWSHGGLLGVSESTYCGVPMVITPMYGDQYLNAKAAEKRKTGKILMYDDINEDNVYNTISEVLHQSYSSNAKYVSNVYRNRQNTPLETAFWWIEHVLETKGNNLTYSSSVDMNWFVYYSYDAILTLAVAFIIGITALVCCTKYFYRCCCAPSSQHLKSKTS